ncbi:MAG: LysM peptidoglycan-binding domain-containing protein, partial [Candidatus Marithrix sp.]|nr:LysM peptidoglycan-binding domain-containing protein [Candidatus Marithrix sp.]
PSGAHIVLKGDTLYNIAKHYGFSIADIAAWNGIQPPYRPLQLGEELRVTPYDANTVLPSPVVPATPVTAPILPVVSPTLSGATIHTIVSGDTAYNIARKYGITVKNLTDWNNLEHPFILSIGQELQVSPSATMMPSTGSFQKVGSLSSTEYMVKKGDNIEIIAQKFGISPATLATWNNFKVPYNIFPGMMLKLTP